MTVVRTNPLPKGRYWIDLIGPDHIAAFEGGVKGLNEAHPGLIHVLSTTHHAKDENQEQNQTGRSWLMVVLDSAGALVWGEGQPTPERDWALFEVTAPAIWDFEAIGTPTIAAPTITSEGDTVQRPDPEKDPLDKLNVDLGNIGKAVAVGIGAMAGLALLVVVVTLAKRK